MKSLDELESCHQELKKEYFHWAKGRKGLRNNGIGSENNNATRERFLKKDSAMVKEINIRVDILKEAIKNNDYHGRYEILREIYVIHPSFHELWFFDWHFDHFFQAGKILTGRLGLKSYLTSSKRGTLEKRFKGISTFVFKRTILLENLFSGVLDCSLFDCAPLDDTQIEAKIIDLNRLSAPSPEDIKSKMPTIFKICRTLLERTDFDALKTDKLLSNNAWLYYAPCNVNEGPIFKKKSEGSRIDILKEINSIDQKKIRSELCKHFEITPILKD